MIREVDLVSYLPPFVGEYKETNLTLIAENPEFVLVWKAADRALKMSLSQRLMNMEFQGLKNLAHSSIP